MKPRHVGHENPTFILSREIFLRVLGAIYLIAFLSYGVQFEGLVGERGILPAAEFLARVAERVGPERFWLLPTLAWFHPSDAFLHFLCGVGLLGSLAVILGFRPWPVFALLWALYLSLVKVGQEFFQFQWDALLLETGFLAIFFSALPSVRWLFLWLLFRLMFSSGVVKLVSGDASWRSLSALTFHYETQPLPTWMGWYVHQLPQPFQKFSCFVMFLIELGAPFLIFAPRRLRLFACFALISFQLLIAATGNYCFFNLLAIALCLLLIDDFFWQAGSRRIPGLSPTSSPQHSPHWRRWCVMPVAGIVLMISGMEMVSLFRVRFPWPFPLIALYQAVAPFEAVNSYGLFAVMTTSRPEIIVEGSRDGVDWKPYEFKWKPGDLKRRPAFVEPHQPRLDWQMWFAALRGHCGNTPWFLNFVGRLLEGSPEVTRLLERNPFPKKPPRFVRALLYDYRFTDLATKRADGRWWRRERKGLYCPKEV